MTNSKMLAAALAAITLAGVLSVSTPASAWGSSGWGSAGFSRDWGSGPRWTDRYWGADYPASCGDWDSAYSAYYGYRGRRCWR
ncbi:MAG: hypothetical protein EKK29_16930 [Hyphomicrobiales bacterium]|nr:MAG: hypothetical protein EKK29_16930 [Hyphomicrobiales bacterium]